MLNYLSTLYVEFLPPHKQRRDVVKKSILMKLIVASLFLTLAACAAKGPVTPLPAFQPKTFDSNAYTTNVDNFLVIFDASSSMAKLNNGQEKFTVAKAFVDRMNQTIPEMGQNSGFISFGHDPSITRKPILADDGLKTYTTAGLNASLENIPVPGGTSPLDKAITAASTNLDGVFSKTALIIVTDGKDLSPKSIQAAKKLNDKMGSALCIYTVLVGNDVKGAALMEEIANVGTCGFSSNAEDLIQGPAMAGFVEKVFLKEREIVKPVVVPAPVAPAVVAPMDSDGDGVPDHLDQCPGTPLGAKVNAAGCWALGDLLFDFDKSEIKPAGFKELDDVIVVLKKNPELKIELQGHTDNKGTKLYNEKLSLRRAMAVKAYLEGKGISSDKLTTKAFGFSKPVSTNDTKEGRALNRRVELNPIK